MKNNTKNNPIWFKYNGLLGKGFRPISRQGWYVTVSFILLLSIDLYLATFLNVILVLGIAIVLAITLYVIMLKTSE